MKRTDEQKDARLDFKRLLQISMVGEEDISGEEVKRIPSVAVAHARSKRLKCRTGQTKKF